MFRFNWLGAAMVVPVGLLALLIRTIFLTDDDTNIQAIMMGIPLIPADLWLRWQRTTAEQKWTQRLLSPNTGGWFAFPVWTLGIGFILVGLFSDFQ